MDGSIECQEILTLLDASGEKTALRQAEQYAMGEIKKRIGGRYNIDNVFNKEGSERDMYMVMITIDIAIYHLYSQKAPRKIPEYRDIRYRDAVEWLVSVGKGETPTTLPEYPQDEYKGEVRVFSLYAPNENKY